MTWLVSRRVKIHDMSNLQETSSVLTVEEDDVERLSWSEDGQLLGVVTHSGTIYIYLSQLPIIWSVFNTHVAVLTSLTELTLYSCEVSCCLGVSQYATDLPVSGECTNIFMKPDCIND
jgi:WD40 repeat protein